MHYTICRENVVVGVYYTLGYLLKCAVFNYNTCMLFYHKESKMVKTRKLICMARGKINLSFVVVLCIGVTAAIWADATMPQTEVYDGLANTAFSSGYMDRADYSGSVNSVGMCDIAALSIGAGAATECTSSSSPVTLFSRYAQYSDARTLDTRPPVGLLLFIR